VDDVGDLDLPEFLAGTVAAARLRRRAGEWDVASGGAGGVRTGDAAWGAFGLAFPWAQATTVERRGDGVEAELDLRLAWQAPEGSLGASLIPGAGQFVFDPSESLSTLTIWPNLFSDQIYLYRPAGREFERRLVPFAGAAALNRDALQRALVAWESLTGGKVVGAESELVEGIEPYGFAPDVRPL
jgi:hypothetical protein